MRAGTAERRGPIRRPAHRPCLSVGTPDAALGRSRGIYSGEDGAGWTEQQRAAARGRMGMARTWLELLACRAGAGRGRPQMDPVGHHRDRVAGQLVRRVRRSGQWGSPPKLVSLTNLWGSDDEESAQLQVGAHCWGWFCDESLSFDGADPVLLFLVP